MSNSGTIRAGMGGWTFEPWEGSFYPEKLASKRQLEFAARHVPTIEVNGTFYSTMKPETFAKWASESPEGFVFSLKGNRFVTNRKVLATAEESMTRFLKSGVAELGDRLGPILWQFAHTKKFEPEDFDAFLQLLPSSQDGVALRHAVEVRHSSFVTPDFVALAARRGVTIVFADHATYPAIADITGAFVYARLQTGSDDNHDCYTPQALDAWGERAKVWASGGAPDDLPRADPAHAAAKTPRDVYVYFITEGKARAPFGAMALMKRLEPK